MSREKQTEEMANEICSEYDCVIPCQSCAYYGYANCRNVKSAEKLYAAGYRKQNTAEWYVNYMVSKKLTNRGRVMHYETYTCSACGKNNGRRRTNYCPNCGAKMKGGE